MNSEQNLKKDINGLIETIIKSKKLEDYKIEKTKFLTKFSNGLSFGLVTFFIVLILGGTVRWSLIVSTGMLILTLVSPRYY